VTSYLFDPSANRFVSDDGSSILSADALKSLAATPGQEITFTAGTPGSGQRLVAPERSLRLRRGTR
jgi:hypothetical protein